MNSQARDHITLLDLYLAYPYKDLDKNLSPKTVQLPYFPKDQIVVGHKNNLHYKEWKRIVLCYLKHMVNGIISGNSFKIPAGLGVLEIQKYKGITPDRIESRKQKKLIIYPNNYFGYRLVVKWLNGTNYGIQFKTMRYFKFNFIRTRWIKNHKTMKKDMSVVFKFNNTKRR